MNKTIVAAGAVLLIVVGGAFLYLLGVSSPEEEYSTTQTQWSQAGDYKIEETPEGTIVTNEKAGFSFKVPEGWEVKGGSFGDIYSLDLLGPNAVLRNDVFLESGCIGGVETQFNKDFVVNINGTVNAISNNSNLYSDKEIIEIDGRVALKTTASDEGEAYSEVIAIEVPLGEEVLLAISFTERSASQGLCNQNFDSILKSFMFE